MLNWRKISAYGFDWTLFVTVLLLLSIGMAAIYSVDLSRGQELIYFKKQLIAIGIGLVLLILASISQRTFFRSSAKLVYAVSIILLIAVLVVGKSIRGTTGWFVFGSFNFQPVEFAKVGIILMLGYIIYHFGRRFQRPLFFFGTAIVTLIPVSLIMMQPDLGSAVLIGLIWFSLMLLVGARKTYILLFIAAIAAVAVFGWFFFLKDYQQARVLNFINPSRDPLGSGYNVTQSIIAVGAGKFFGRGLGFGSQSQLRFLPEAQTDFVFSVIGEELGFAGVSAMIILFGIMFWRMAVIARSVNDDFASAVVCGVMVLFFSQIVINIGANTGILPVTGITLPFISYGGSSLIINLLLVGIVQSMIENKYQ